MTNTFRITPRAEQNLKNIGRYTLKMWGRDQRDVYLRAIDRRFAWLAERPERGRHRPEVREGYHSYLQGSHVVFYLIRDGGIDIIGIPHQRMDIMNYFSG
ncbi:MAG: type II toxin-antitoxin system RelE/ParE family toxin [Gammaproteobacteria bacterium]|nr:type II toxin-antitoxin system RelE/ParE family toxin [Gammaproteobacteria bacterium]